MIEDICSKVAAFFKYAVFSTFAVGTCECDDIHSRRDTEKKKLLREKKLSDMDKEILSLKFF